MSNNETRTAEITIDSLSQKDARIVLGRILHNMNQRGMLHQHLSDDEVFELYLMVVSLADREEQTEINTAEAMAAFYTQTLEKELEKKAQTFVAETAAFLKEEQVAEDVIYLFTMPEEAGETVIRCEVSGRITPRAEVPRDKRVAAPQPAAKQPPVTFHPRLLVEHFIEEVKAAKKQSPEVFEFLDLRMAGIHPKEEAMLRDVLFAAAELLAFNGMAEEPTMEDIANVLLDTDHVTLHLISAYVTHQNTQYIIGDDNALNIMPAVLLLHQHCISLAWAVRPDGPVALPRFSNLLMNVADYLTYTDVMKEEGGWE